MAAPEEPDAIISLGRGTTILVVSTLLLLVFSFIGRVLVARHLSLDDFGDFNLGISFTGFLSLVALLGLHQAIARTLAHEQDAGMRRKVIRLGLVVTATAAVVGSTAVYLLAPQIASLFATAAIGQGHADLTLVFRLFSITLGFTLGTTLVASIFQGFENTGPNAWFNQVAQPAAFVVFVTAILVFHLHLNLTSTLWAWLFSNAAMFAGATIYAVARLPPLLPKANIPARPIDGLFSLSIALWGVTTMQFVTAYADTLILGSFWDGKSVGLYSGAMQLGRLLLAANGALTFIFLPVAARLHRRGDLDSLRRVYVTSTRWTLVATLPLFLLFAILPEDSLSAVFGTTFAPASLALTIITIGSFLSVLVGPVNSALAGLGMTPVLLATTVISAGSNVILSFALIPSYGLVGAAVAWAVARALYPGSGLVTLFLAHGVTPFRRSLLVPRGPAAPTRQ